MPDTTFLSLAGAKVIAAERITGLANAVLHLFKFGFNPGVGNVLADYTAQECDFDGYAAITIATWTGPYLAPGTGWMCLGGQRVFAWSHVSADVGNDVGGTYLVDAAGNLLDVTVFEAASPMAGPGQTVITEPFEAIAAG